jgi:hypothetical protein
MCNENLHEMDLATHVKKNFHTGTVLKHAQTSSYVSSGLSRRTAIVAPEKRLTKLEHIKWQLHVKGLLFDYLSTGDSSILQRVELLLNMYEHMERLSLLELAVWKAACMSHTAEVKPDDSQSIMTTLHDAILFTAKHQYTWKNYRTETRKSNAHEIIIKQVLPFLGKP